MYRWKRVLRRLKRTVHRIAVAAVTLGIAGFVISSFALARSGARLPDLKDQEIAIVAGVLAVSAIVYWMFIATIVWRWNRMRRRHNHALAHIAGVAHRGSSARTGFARLAPAFRKALPPASTLSPAAFEQEVAWVFSVLFSLKAEVVGKANDGGIDVKLYDQRGALAAIIQTKRYNPENSLPPGFLRELDSCKQRMGVQCAYLVTTAHFSPEVRRQAQEMDINLVDGHLFEEWRRRAHANDNNRPSRSK